MTHNESRSSAYREGVLALFTGSIYGATHTLTGHPLDTIKSKMQLQQGFTQGGSVAVASKIWKEEGFRGFYRGCVAPLWGSAVYRAFMMSGYEFAYTYIELHTPSDHWLKQEVFFGLRPMVPTAILFSSMTRAFFENPIEYAKVMGQTGKKWIFKDIYRGFGWQVVRTTSLLLPIFSSLDVFRRKTDFMKTLWGNFVVMGGASGVSFLMIWPLETMKNLAQSGTPHAGATFQQRIDYLGGYRGLYRGCGPGTLSGALRNGCAIVSMVYAQSWATQLGLRDL